MFSVGLDVDTLLVSTVMVTLLNEIKLCARKLDYFLDPLSNLIERLFGKIQSFIINNRLFYIIYNNKIKMENEQLAGNFEYSDDLKEGFSEDLHISDHLNKYSKPKTEEEFGYYLAGLIEGDGYFGDNRIEIAFHKEDTFLAY